MVAVPTGPGGRRIGEDHPNAVLSDHEVELIRALYEEAVLGVKVWSYKTLALKFEVSKETIRDIVKFRRRATTPEGFRTPKPANDLADVDAANDV